MNKTDVGDIADGLKLIESETENTINNTLKDFDPNKKILYKEYDVSTALYYDRVKAKLVNEFKRFYIYDLNKFLLHFFSLVTIIDFV